MNFSKALELIKKGELLTRTNWNGPDQFVFLVPGSRFEVNRAPLLGIYPHGKMIDYRPHIDIRVTSGEIMPWVPSQSDLMAEDWEITAED